MNLEFSSRELGLLFDIVDTRLSEWRQQIYHAETPRFRDELKAEEVVLTQLVEKLRQASRSAAA